MNVSPFRDEDPMVLRNRPEDRAEVTVALKDESPPEVSETKSSSSPSEDDRPKPDDEGVVDSPKPQPSTAFTIEFDDGKAVDKQKYENLVKKSQARHQRVQSMSASWQKPSPNSSSQQRPPMSAKLPRKAHGYHSEGYFSSDQEEAFAPTRRRNDRLAQDKKPQNGADNFFSPGCERDSFRAKHFKIENNSQIVNSPSVDRKAVFDRSPENAIYSSCRKSKSPIVDGIMSRSDALPSRHALNLPLKHPHTSSFNRIPPETTIGPHFINVCPLRSPYFSEQNLADVQMIADTSSPELDLLTPDVPMTPGTPLRPGSGRNSSGAATGQSQRSKDLLISPAVLTISPVHTKKEIVANDGRESPSSTVSEAGTYTIEADNYTEEQKAKMNIDEAFCVEDFAEPIRQALDKIQNSETPLKTRTVDAETRRDAVITKEPRSNNFVSNIREELLLAKSIPDPIRKVSTDKNVLEISCCYESPTESNEPPHLTKSVKPAKSYLEKIKLRVKNIGEKTFQKSPKTPEFSVDVGSFTSVTASGVLGSVNQKSSKLDNNRMKEKLSRKNSLTKSQIDSSEYVHHILRDNLVLQKVTNDSFTPSNEDNNIVSDDNLGSDDDKKTQEQILIGKLSHLSLNRCQGDKSWIQEWANSVQKYNKESAMGTSEIALSGLPPISPRHSVFVKGSPVKSVPSNCNSPTKIPSPVGTLVRQRAPVPDILTSTPDTEFHLKNTQDVILNLQEKLQNAKSTPLANLDLNHHMFHNKINSKLPVSQLSRSNSLNYRLYRKSNSAESSPLRNPGNYLVTGTHGLPSNTRLLLSNLGASKSLDTDPNISPVNGGYYSPILSKMQATIRNANNDNILHGRLRIEDLHPDHDLFVNSDRRHSRHHSFDDRNIRECAISPDQYEDDLNNANMTQSLNLKSNTKNVFNDSDDRKTTHRSSIHNVNGQRHLIDQSSRNVLSPSNPRLNNVKLSHHRGLSDSCTANNKGQNNPHNQRSNHKQNNQSSPIRRSSSFNVVNKNNNIYDSNNIKNMLGSPVSRISSAGRTRNYCHRPQERMQLSCEFAGRNNTPEVDCMSEDSDNISTGGFHSDYDRRSLRKNVVNDLLAGARCNRAFALRRARIESPDARSQQNINASSPRCPGTPEMKRKFCSSDTKRPARAHSRDSRGIGPPNRISDCRPDVCQVQLTDNNKNHKNKKISETVKQNLTNRLTRSTSAAKDFLPKSSDKAAKKPNMKTSLNMSTASKEVEFSNWKKRSSYDPMKAAQEGKKKVTVPNKNKPIDAGPAPIARIEDISSPSHSSPVHRSKSFNCTTTPIDERLYLLQVQQNEGSSDTDDFEDRLICTLPAEGSANAPILKMISAAEMDAENIEAKLENPPDVTKRSKRVAQNNQIKISPDYITRLQVNHDIDPKRQLLADKRRTYLLDSDIRQSDYDSLMEADKRRTFILDSDTTTNSTTNGSGSRRNSSVYSDERIQNERLTDSDVESDTEPIVNVVPRTKSRSVPPQQRHSGDFSMSSSTCSATKDNASSKKIQPRYLDISRYKSNDPQAKNFLRRDPSKTYVGVLPVSDHRHQAKKNAARQTEQEQKNKELEKWKRRASYDPRKAAAQGKSKPSGNKSPSNSVLRSQSFHGPMMQTTKLFIIPSERNDVDKLDPDASSDNEF